MPNSFRLFSSSCSLPPLIWCGTLWKPSACLYHPGPGVHSNDGSSPAAAPADPTLRWDTSVGLSWPMVQQWLLIDVPAFQVSLSYWTVVFQTIFPSILTLVFPGTVKFDYFLHIFPASPASPILLLHPPSFAFDAWAKLQWKQIWARMCIQALCQLFCKKITQATRSHLSQVIVTNPELANSFAFPSPTGYWAGSAVVASWPMWSQGLEGFHLLQWLARCPQIPRDDHQV